LFSKLLKEIKSVFKYFSKRTT